jgi:hypothetical protein
LKWFGCIARLSQWGVEGISSFKLILPNVATHEGRGWGGRHPVAATGNAFELTSLGLYCTAQSYSKILVPVLFSIVDLHRFDSDPDSDPIFHFDADPDPDPASVRGGTIFNFLDSNYIEIFFKKG